MRRTAASISGRTPAKPWPDHGPSTPPPLRASNFFEARMIIGVPKEIKDNEARVGVTPAGAKALIEAGHTVLVETQAGAQSGFPDDEYQNAGAEIVGDAGWVWGKSEHRGQGQGAHRARIRLLPRGAGPVHLSPSRAPARAN